MLNNLLFSEGPLSLAFGINPVTSMMLGYVLFVSYHIYRFSEKALRSEKDWGRYQKHFLWTVLYVLLFVISQNLLTAGIFWIMIGKHFSQLLYFYKQYHRDKNSLKKNTSWHLASDLAFMGAIMLCCWQYDSTSFDVLTWDPDSLQTQCIMVLLFLSIAIRSALFPFSRWLNQTLIAPTPVSALLHAGVVNAGAILIIKMSPVISQYPTLLYGILAVGLITLVLGVKTKWGQSDIKRKLIYSTVSQMGYLFVQIGLGLFGSALLHMLSHGLSKSYLFLNSGNTLVKYTQTTQSKQSIMLSIGIILIAGALLLGAQGMLQYWGVIIHKKILVSAFAMISISEYLYHILPFKPKLQAFLCHITLIFVMLIAYFLTLFQMEAMLLNRLSTNVNILIPETTAALVIICLYFVAKNNQRLSGLIFKRLRTV